MSRWQPHCVFHHWLGLHLFSSVLRRARLESSRWGGSDVGTLGQERQTRPQDTQFSALLIISVPPKGSAQRGGTGPEATGSLHVAGFPNRLAAADRWVQGRGGVRFWGREEPSGCQRREPDFHHTCLFALKPGTAEGQEGRGGDTLHVRRCPRLGHPCQKAMRPIPHSDVHPDSHKEI